MQKTFVAALRGIIIIGRLIGIAVLLTLIAGPAPSRAASVVTTQALGKNCSGKSLCDVQFPLLASNQKFQINIVSCGLQYTARPAIIQLTLGRLTSGSYTTGHFLAPLSDMGTDSQNVMHINVSTPVQFVVAGGSRPMVRISLAASAATFYGFCSISGVLTTTP